MKAASKEHGNLQILIVPSAKQHCHDVSFLLLQGHMTFMAQVIGVMYYRALWL